MDIGETSGFDSLGVGLHTFRGFGDIAANEDDLNEPLGTPGRCAEIHGLISGWRCHRLPRRHQLNVGVIHEIGVDARLLNIGVNALGCMAVACVEEHREDAVVRAVESDINRNAIGVAIC